MQRRPLSKRAMEIHVNAGGVILEPARLVPGTCSLNAKKHFSSTLNDLGQIRAPAQFPGVYPLAEYTSSLKTEYFERSTGGAPREVYPAEIVSRAMWRRETHSTPNEVKPIPANPRELN